MTADFDFFLYRAREEDGRRFEELEEEEPSDEVSEE
jgi:hypothetical protein